MLRSSLKLIFIVLGVVLLVVGGLLVFNEVSSPSVEITLTGESNAIDNIVLLDDRQLIPTSGEGLVYKSSARTGTNNIKVVGPYVKTVSQNIDLNRFDDNKLTINLEAITPNDVALQSLGDNVTSVFGVKSFDYEIVFVSVNELIAGDDGSRQPRLLYYDRDFRAWQLLDPSIIETTNIDISESALKYYYELYSE